MTSSKIYIDHEEHSCQLNGAKVASTQGYRYSGEHADEEYRADPVTEEGAGHCIRPFYCN